MPTRPEVPTPGMRAHLLRWSEETAGRVEITRFPNPYDLDIFSGVRQKFEGARLAAPSWAASKQGVSNSLVVNLPDRIFEIDVTARAVADLEGRLEKYVFPCYSTYADLILKLAREKLMLGLGIRSNHPDHIVRVANCPEIDRALGLSTIDGQAMFINPGPRSPLTTFEYFMQTIDRSDTADSAQNLGWRAIVADALGYEVFSNSDFYDFAKTRRKANVDKHEADKTFNDTPWDGRWFPLPFISLSEVNGFLQGQRLHGDDLATVEKMVDAKNWAYTSHARDAERGKRVQHAVPFMLFLFRAREASLLRSPRFMELQRRIYGHTYSANELITMLYGKSDEIAFALRFFYRHLLIDLEVSELETYVEQYFHSTLEELDEFGHPWDLASVHARINNLRARMTGESPEGLIELEKKQLTIYAERMAKEMALRAEMEERGRVKELVLVNAGLETDAEGHELTGIPRRPWPRILVLADPMTHMLTDAFRGLPPDYISAHNAGMYSWLAELSPSRPDVTLLQFRLANGELFGAAKKLRALRNENGLEFKRQFRIVRMITSAVIALGLPDVDQENKRKLIRTLGEIIATVPR